MSLNFKDLYLRRAGATQMSFHNGRRKNDYEVVCVQGEKKIFYSDPVMKTNHRIRCGPKGFTLTTSSFFNSIAVHYISRKQVLKDVLNFNHLYFWVNVRNVSFEGFSFTIVAQIFIRINSMKALLLIAEILYTMESFTLLGVVIRLLKFFQLCPSPPHSPDFFRGVLVQNKDPVQQQYNSDRYFTFLYSCFCFTVSIHRISIYTNMQLTLVLYFCNLLAL